MAQLVERAPHEARPRVLSVGQEFDSYSQPFAALNPPFLSPPLLSHLQLYHLNKVIKSSSFSAPEEEFARKSLRATDPQRWVIVRSFLLEGRRRVERGAKLP